MKKVTLYTKMHCPYCVGAKSLLEEKGQEYEEIDIGKNPSERSNMMERAHGGHTVPQIFIEDKHVGGYDDLYALDQAGKLDAMLTNGS